MKFVTSNRAMAGLGAGDSRVVPDDVAAKLESDGILSSVQDWPTQGGSVPLVAAPPVVAKPRLSLPGRRQSYLTK